MKELLNLVWRNNSSQSTLVLVLGYFQPTERLKFAVRELTSICFLKFCYVSATKLANTNQIEVYEHKQLIMHIVVQYFLFLLNYGLLF